MIKILKDFFLLILPSASACTDAEASLKEIIDDLSYSLIVEWDQKNPQFYSEKIAKFESELSDGGISPSDMLNILQLDELIIISQRLKSKTISELEALSTVTHYIFKNYNQDPSWNRKKVVGVTAMIVVAAISVGVSSKIIGNLKNKNGHF